MISVRATCSAEMECDTRTGQLFPRQRCSRAKETRRKAAAAVVGTKDTKEEGDAGLLEVNAALVLLTVMAMGFVDVMWKGTRQIGQATLCFAFTENI
jgi:hypothetical protein